MQAQDILYQAMRRCGSLRPGYVAPPELLADGLSEWFAFFDSLNAERTTSYSIPDQVFPVTGPGSKTGGNGYSIGPSGADWIAPRPESIIRANCVLPGTTPVYIPLSPISAEQWASQSIRSIPGINVTSLFYYDPQWPNGVFNVFPPLSGGCSIELFTWGALTPPATLATVVSLPPGYLDMVVQNLAERLYGLVTKEAVIHPLPYQIIAAKAAASLARIRRVNRPIPTLVNDFKGRGKSGGYDSLVTYTGMPY